MSSKPGPAAWGGARSHRPVRIRGVLSRHEICLVQGSHPPFKCLRFNELVDCKEEGIGRNHYRSGGSISFHLIPYARVSWCKTEVQNCSGASPKTRSRLQAFEKVFRPSKARTKKTFGARLGGGSFALATPGSGSFFSEVHMAARLHVASVIPFQLSHFSTGHQWPSAWPSG